MRTYSYKIMIENGWSQRGVRVEAKDSKEAFELATERYKAKGYKPPMLMKWHYVK